MPSTLPPTSGYTYALELSVDEARAMDAAEASVGGAHPFVDIGFEANEGNDIGGSPVWGSDGSLVHGRDLPFPALPAQTTDRFKAGVYLITLEGDHLDTIEVPMDMITNCTFGGKDLKTLYITAGHTLWSTPVQTQGALHWPKAK